MKALNRIAFFLTLILLITLFAACEFNPRQKYADIQINFPGQTEEAALSRAGTIPAKTLYAHVTLIRVETPDTSWEKSQNFDNKQEGRSQPAQVYIDTSVKFYPSTGNFGKLKVHNVPFGNYSSIIIELRETPFSKVNGVDTGGSVSGDYCQGELFSIPSKTDFSIDISDIYQVDFYENTPSNATGTAAGNGDADKPAFSQFVLRKGKLQKPAEPSIDGCEFTGWYYKNSGQEENPLSDWYFYEPDLEPVNWDSFLDGKMAFDFENFQIMGDGLELKAGWGPKDPGSGGDNGEGGGNTGDGETSGGESDAPEYYAIYYSETNDSGTLTYYTVGKTQKGDKWYIKHVQGCENEDGKFDGIICRMPDGSSDGEYYNYKAGILNKTTDFAQKTALNAYITATSNIMQVIWAGLQDNLDDELNASSYLSEWDKPQIVDNYCIYSVALGYEAVFFDFDFDFESINNPTFGETSYYIAYDKYNTSWDNKGKATQGDTECAFPFVTKYEESPYFVRTDRSFQLVKYDHENDTFYKYTSGTGDGEVNVVWSIEEYGSVTDNVFLSTNDKGETYTNVEGQNEGNKPLAYFIYYSSVERQQEITLKAEVKQEEEIIDTQSVKIKLEVSQ